VRTLSPYKDYSSLLRWQANMCVHIATTELHQHRYVVVFGVFILFYCLWSYFWTPHLIWLFVTLVELLGLVDAFFLVYKDFGVCAYLVRHWSGYERTGPLRAWVATKVVDSLRACVNVADYYDTSFACTLTFVRAIEAGVESSFATEHMWFAIADCFLCFGEDD
jgi:hypothetical protein